MHSEITIIMFENARLKLIDSEFKKMDVSYTWILEHMRISSLEEKKNSSTFFPKTEKYELFKQITNLKPINDIDGFYKKIDDLIDEKISIETKHYKTLQ